MLWNNIVALFKKPSKKGSNSKTSTIGQRKTEHTQQRRRIDPTRIGDLGEYKIEVQLRQFPKENRYLNDLLLVNPKSYTGYSQIDHVLITPYGLFVIETKNYEGYIKGRRRDKFWRVNGKFNMYNPLRQNYGHIKTLEEILNEFKGIKYVSMISFTKRCELHIEDQELRSVESDSDELVVYDIKLTEYIERKLCMLKRQNPIPSLSESDISRIFELLKAKNITDSKIRGAHVKKIHEPQDKKTTTDIKNAGKVQNKPIK